MKRVFTQSDFKKICHVCGRNCQEDDSSTTIPITFQWKYGGSTVYLCGSFSQWQTKLQMHKDTETEPFSLELSLLPGTYQFKFIVDGVWKFDPNDHTIDDGVDLKNNIIEIFPVRHHDGEEDFDDLSLVEIPTKTSSGNSRVMKIVYQFPAKSVEIKGAWDDWTQTIPLQKSHNNFTGVEEFTIALKVAPGNYHFKFLVDENWTTSPTYPLAKDPSGKENNVLVVSSEMKKPCSEYVDWQRKGTLTWRREEGKWTECGRIHHTFQGHSMNVVCDRIYIFGGLANNKFTNTLFVFDPRTNEFSLVEDQTGEIPEARAFHQTSVFGTKILVYGGFNQQYLNDCYIFDTATNTWGEIVIHPTEGEPDPRERATLAPYAENKLILFGGFYCTPDLEVEKYFNDTHVLNLSLTKWVKPKVKGEIPQGRSAHTANFIKGNMYVFGGITSKQKNLNDMWVLKTSQTLPFEWKKIEPKGIIPKARHGHSAIIAQNNIIYYGGKGNEKENFYCDLFVFDTMTDTWVFPSVEGTKPTPRYYHGSVTLYHGKEFIIFGGIRPKEFLNYPRMYILDAENKEGH